MRQWGAEFKSAIVVILILTLLLFGAKLPMMQNLPVVGRVFKWWGSVFSSTTT